MNDRIAAHDKEVLELANNVQQHTRRRLAIPASASYPP